MNQPLQRRAGSNIGVVAAFTPRFTNSLAELFPIVLGDMDLWNGPPKDGESRAVGQVTVYNYSTVPIQFDLFVVGPDGKEFFVKTTSVSPPPATPYFTVYSLSYPMVLVKGEKLRMRVTAPGYLGGAYVQTDTAMLYGTQSDRVDITTTLKKMVEPPQGKGLGAALGPQPIVVVNIDSITHNLDVYFNDDAEGPDTLVIQGLELLPDQPVQVPFASLSYDQMLKAQLQEPIVDADAVVRWFSLYIEYDLGVRDSD